MQSHVVYTRFSVRYVFLFNVCNTIEIIDILSPIWRKNNTFQGDCKEIKNIFKRKTHFMKNAGYAVSSLAQQFCMFLPGGPFGESFESGSSRNSATVNLH